MNYLRFDGWVAPDPRDEDLHQAMHAARYSLSSLTQAEAYRILAAAEAYIHFAAHPAPTADIVKQLRELRTRVRAPKVSP